MTITVLTRWKSNNHEEIIKAARQAKPYWEKNGAEFFHLSKLHTGEWVGMYLIAIRFPNWSTYAKLQEDLASNTAYQKIYARVQSIAELVARNILVGIEL